MASFWKPNRSKNEGNYSFSPQWFAVESQFPKVQTKGEKEDKKNMERKTQLSRKKATEKEGRK